MKAVTLLLFATLIIVGPTLASATVCTFEAFTGSGQVPDGYCGANWNNNWTYYDGAQSPYTAHSGVERIYPTDDACCGTINFLSPVTFNGAWFAGYSGLSGDIVYDMYFGGNLVATATLDSTVLSDVPLFFASGYGGLVDELTITSGTDRWILDDLTYNGTTPEPGTLALTGTALLAGIGAIRRRYL
ncbi:MAG TPA: PEP-CTERM sorting domain-containing protein [Candidatus Saccharimonadales bacterium]|nr:PEP-CTERM sorting domain-containing protein [Candidatus Saccharimonadales bacterium]HVO80959.1 PEP-CTERM sorting domain-containing protein [Terriglobales bacterium]